MPPPPQLCVHFDQTAHRKDSTQTVGKWGTAITDCSTCDALVSSVSDSRRAAFLITWRCCGEMGVSGEILKQQKAFSMAY